jgi:hypothetical protein
LNENKAIGLVWYFIAVIIVTSSWRYNDTLPAEFLSGAFAVWCLRNGMDYFSKPNNNG